MATRGLNREEMGGICSPCDDEEGVTAQVEAEREQAVVGEVEERLELLRFLVTSQKRKRRHVEEHDADVLHQLAPDRDRAGLGEMPFPRGEGEGMWIETVHVRTHHVAVDREIADEAKEALADKDVDPPPRESVQVVELESRQELQLLDAREGTTATRALDDALRIFHLEEVRRPGSPMRDACRNRRQTALSDRRFHGALLSRRAFPVKEQAISFYKKMKMSRLSKSGNVGNWTE